MGKTRIIEILRHIKSVELYLYKPNEKSSVGFESIEVRRFNIKSDINIRCRMVRAWGIYEKAANPSKKSDLLISFIENFSSALYRFDYPGDFISGAGIGLNVYDQVDQIQLSHRSESRHILIYIFS